MIEGVQDLMPGRTASVTDIIANTVGACLGLLIVAAFTAARRPRAGHPKPAVAPTH